MARISLHGSVRVDCFARLEEAAHTLLMDEVNDETDVQALAHADAAWLSSAADVALVVGMSREDWIKAYDDNQAHYARIGYTLS